MKEENGDYPGSSSQLWSVLLLVEKSQDQNRACPLQPAQELN